MKGETYLKINKKVVIFSIFILLCFGGFLLFYNYPKTIDIEYPAVEAHINNPASMQKTTIKIKGTLYRPLFKDKSFKGQLLIEKYDFTKNNALTNIIFSKDIRNSFGSLVYSNLINGRSTLDSLGAIWISGDFDKVKIWVYEPIDAEKKQSTDLTICAPAQTFEEALSISKSVPGDGK
jgi:hypothetical protein